MSGGGISFQSQGRDTEALKSLEHIKFCFKFTISEFFEKIPGVSKTRGQDRDRGRGRGLSFFENAVLGLGLGLG